jgi:large subunit ribosomal protein L29
MPSCQLSFPHTPSKRHYFCVRIHLLACPSTRESTLCETTLTPRLPRLLASSSPSSSQRLKAADIKGKTVAEIDAEVETRKRALFDLRLKQATRQEIKTDQFKLLKKEVAMMLTVKRQMEIENGVDRRTSKAAAKKAALSAGTLVRGLN